MHRPLGWDLPGSIPRLAHPGTPRDQTRRGSPTEDLEHIGDTSRALHSHSSKEEEPSMDLGDPLSAIFGSLTIQDQRTAGMAQQLNQVDERIQVGRPGGWPPDLVTGSADPLSGRPTCQVDHLPPH
ncbi:hypothetical protein U9M48_012905 [Paspalum notatum var. saurae]|uniref:Uncharacterized protein n=1 Tax=Paspalum notatum var. saurae TaxID=547442 RepID=A0AAQ3SZ63_PASNO